MTSIFPGNGGGSYVLPIKRAVRKAEALDAAPGLVTLGKVGFAACVTSSVPGQALTGRGCD
jgi:hypothetical protein